MTDHDHMQRARERSARELEKFIDLRTDYDLDDIAVEALLAGAAALRSQSAQAVPEVVEARPLEEWHEDYGCSVWFTWSDGDWLGEPSYIGSPLCDDWPGYHTHFIPHPAFPPRPAAPNPEGR